MGDEVRAIYVDAFARFARRHGAWVVAGSALLPRGREVSNTSLTFAPDGRVAGETRKVNLVPTMEDVLGLTPGAPDEVHATPTPFGRVTTLVCYDGFAVSHRRAELRFTPMVPRVASATDVLAHPAANPWPWDEPWTFGDRPAPPRPRSAQWMDEGLACALASTSIPYAVTAHLVGRVLDNRFDGRSQIFAGSRILAEAGRSDGEDVILHTVPMRQSVETSTAAS
jgi:predicted amidohydrolase